MSATSSVTASVNLARPVGLAPKPSKLNDRVVTKAEVFKEHSCRTGLKMLAVALIVVGVAMILSAFAFGFSLLCAGKILALDAVVLPIVATLGVKWAVTAFSIAALVGLSKLVGGILILRNRPEAINPDVTVEIFKDPKGGDPVFKLEDTIALDFSGKELFEIPQVLSKFPSLRSLNLANNEIRNLSSQSLSLISNLFTLDLTNNGLTSLPDDMGKVGNLKQLGLKNNDLTSLSESIGDLKNVTHLDLSNNKLKTLPDSIGQMTKLEELDLSNNELETLPDSIGDLTNLKVLKLTQNQLKTLPTSIAKLTNLKLIFVDRNPLESIPNEVNDKNLPSLEFVHIDEEPRKLLTGLSQDKTDRALYDRLLSYIRNEEDLNRIKELNLRYYDGDGDSIKLKTVPSLIQKMTELEELILSGNEITALPEFLKGLKKLRKIDLSYNGLTELPEWIGELSNLEELILTGNQFKSLPASLANLTKLKRIHAEHNPIESFPLEFTEENMPSLECFLVDEALHIKLPGIHPLKMSRDLLYDGLKISEVINTTTLDLSRGRGYGMPSYLKHLKHLTTVILPSRGIGFYREFEFADPLKITVLDLSGNNTYDNYGSLGFEISLAKLKNMIDLNLSNNTLNKVPEEIRGMKKLQVLDLSLNPITEIPEWIGELTELRRLNLSSSQLKTLPASIAKLAKLTHIYVDGNLLQAPLPDFKDANFPNLQQFLIDDPKLVPGITKTTITANNNKLDLSSQKLSQIPSQVFGMKDLTELDVSNNGITVIPPEIGRLTNLTVLKLSGNQLKALPKAVSDLKNLTTIYIDGNKFEDSYSITDILNKQSLPKLAVIKVERNIRNYFYHNRDDKEFIIVEPPSKQE
jgi:Leucine-rich repeat (LRR) protein